MIHTVTLEMQGVLPEVAAHRRSIHAGARCQHEITVERWHGETGMHRTVKHRPCRAVASALVGTRSFCLDHLD